MPVEVILRDFIKVSGCNPRDRTQALACNRIFMPKRWVLQRYSLLCVADLFALGVDCQWLIGCSAVQAVRIP